MGARVLLFMLACGAPEAPQAPPAVEEVEVPPPVEVGPWTPAWPLEGGGARVEASAGVGEVRVLTTKGLVVASGTGCGPGALQVEESALLGLPLGEEAEFPRAPANPAATVERVGWRLAGLLGPREGLVPGGAAPSEPARHEGIWVRSVRKTRRSGAPPVLVVVGDRDDSVIVTLLDREADAVFGSHVLSSEHGPFERVGATPAWDLDGDGAAEIAVWGDSPHGSLRAVYRVDLGPAPSLDPLWLAEAPRAACP